MSKPGLVALALVLFGAFTASRGTAAAPKRAAALSVEDLYRFDAPTSGVLAPDGVRAAFIRQWVDSRMRQARRSLWVVDGTENKARPVEADEPDARAPVFSPDGRWIAFLSTRPRPRGWQQTPKAPAESDPATDIWIVASRGGTAVPLAGAKKAYGRVFNDGFYGRVMFSPDGNRLAFVADDGIDPRTSEEKSADVTVVREDQGEGYTGYGPAQVWIAHLAEGREKTASRKIERLTSDDVWYGDPHWSPDGRTIVVHANRTHDRESARYSINKNYDLWEIDAKTHAVRQLTSGAGPEVSPRFSPDGKRLLCLSVPRKGSHRDVFNLMVVEPGKSGARTIMPFDQDGARAEKSPHPAPVFPLPHDCWDGNGHVIYRADRGTRSQWYRLDVKTGAATPLVIPSLGKTEKPPDDWVGRRQRLRQMMPAGNLFLKERLLAKSAIVRWKSADGLTIEGILTLPPGAIGKAPHPLVLYPHGGPHSRSSLGFDFTVQIFAANGYAVFQPNFRGSAGYGQKLIDADRDDFGGGDMRDILTGIEDLAEKKVIDRSRQFVYGISYGGFMTCWLVGHTNQFRAAVAQNAVTDLTAMWGLSDIQSWTEWEFGGRPWEVSGAMRKHSPLTYVDRVKTPTLILHSRDDRRCPLPMGRMFYRSLLARNVPTQMVIYPDEGHGIRQPRHREDVLRRVLAWFKRHDK